MISFLYFREILPIDFSQAVAKYYIMALSHEIVGRKHDFPPNETPSRIKPPDILHDTSLGFSAYQGAGGIFTESLYTSVVTGVEKLLEPHEGKIFDYEEPTLYQILDHEDRFKYPERYYASIRAKIKELQEPGEGEIFDPKKPTYYQIKGFEDKINHPFPAESPRPKVEAHLTPEQILAYLMLREGHVAMPEVDRQKYLLSDRPLFEEILKMRRLGHALPQQEQVQDLAAVA